MLVVTRLKTNLAALKSEVYKIDVDQLKTVPVDLAKLSNAVKNDVVKKTDYNTKVTSIERQIAGVTKNAVDNLADITKVKAVDTNNFVLKTKLTADVNTLETKIDTVDKKMPNVSGLATKSSLTSYLQTTTFNSKITEVENKIKAADNIAKSANTKANTIRSDLTGYAKKADVATDITAIKNDKITTWKSTGIFYYFGNSNMNVVADSGGVLADFKNDGRMYVYLSSNHFQQNKVIIPNNDNVINIYCVYEIQPIASSRDTTFTIQNALFGASQITKNADTSKYNYKGYGMCFDERSQFGHTITKGGFAHTTNARNVLIFGADMSFSVHVTKRANNIYFMGDGLTQGNDDTTIYVEKNFYRNFTNPGKKFVLSLHYNGDDSYLFVNGRQELKFKCKTDQLVKEKLCIGNLSDQWTTSESEKTGLYGNIYDFLVDYQAIIGVGPIYDMHRYLMTKHNISP